jgi:hypothetical protein
VNGVHFQRSKGHVGGYGRGGGVDLRIAGGGRGEPDEVTVLDAESRMGGRVVWLALVAA